jgi:hypothetical protein
MSTKNTPIPRTIFSVVEFAPIMVFGYLGSAAGLDLRERFLISGGLALIVLVAHRVIKWPMNSLALSANIFLLIEAAAFIKYIELVAVVFGFVRESAIFVVTLVVGIVRTFASPRGFLDLEGGKPPAVRRGSCYLLLGTCVALGMSIMFRGRTALSAALPFVGLLVLQRVLREIASRKGPHYPRLLGADRHGETSCDACT